jgi:hypothetical protein
VEELGSGPANPVCLPVQNSNAWMTFSLFSGIKQASFVPLLEEKRDQQYPACWRIATHMIETWQQP